MKTLIFSATYNEAGNVQALLTGIAAEAPHADILIVDDNSRDGTVEVMRGLEMEKLVIVQRPGKLGLGTAHLFAFCYAAHYGYDVLVTMDADGSHEPSSISELLEKIQRGSDFVIGSRYAPGGACDYFGYRLRVSQAANIAARILLGVRISEFTTSFRAFRVDGLKTLSFPDLLVGGYSFFLTTVVELARRKMRLSEVPIHFRERGYGTSKIPPFEVFRGMANLMRLAAIKHLTRRPSLETQSLHACKNCENPYSFVITHGVSGVCLHCGAAR